MKTLEEHIAERAALVRPPERLTVPEAAEKYRKLNNPGSYVGPWDNEFAGYLVEPMETLTSLEYTGMIFAGPARCGKSDMFFNWMGHTAICDPADMMVIHMTQNTARDWSQVDLRKTFRASPKIGECVTPGRQNMNTHDIKFQSGMHLLVKWPTITELSGKTTPRVWLMDYDRMPSNVDGEGAPYWLAKKRTQTFRQFGMTVAESSPGHVVQNPKWLARTPHEAPPCEGILSLYNSGDRRRFYWPCPSCGTPFEPDFSLLEYPDSNDFLEAAEAAVMKCPHCSYGIEHRHKTELNRIGRWVKDGMFWRGGNEFDGTPFESDIASFWLKGAAAAFSTWKNLVFEYLTALKDYEDTGSEEALKTTVTTSQGLPYTPKSTESLRLPEELKARAEDWGGSVEEPVVPKGVRFLVATVDVQAGGRPSFVVHIHGFGEGRDVWVIDTFKIRKSPTRKDSEGESELIDPAAYLEDWNALVEQVIERSYPLADDSGRRMAVKMTACDSGGREGVTTNAYNFWRSLRTGGDGYHRRFLLLKGAPSKNAARVHVSYPDSNRKDRNAGARGDIPVLLINSDMMKDQVAAKLGREEPGGGMIHWPKWIPDWFFTQMTAEVRTPEGWTNPSKKRNESWDLLVYAEALALHENIKIEAIRWDKPPSWAADWDENTLVFQDDAVAALVKSSGAGVDLASLGEDLA